MVRGYAEPAPDKIIFPPAHCCLPSAKCHLPHTTESTKHAVKPPPLTKEEYTRFDVPDALLCRICPADTSDGTDACVVIQGEHIDDSELVCDLDGYPDVADALRNGGCAYAFDFLAACGRWPWMHRPPWHVGPREGPTWIEQVKSSQVRRTRGMQEAPATWRRG